MATRPRFFGQYLVSRGLITERSLAEAAARQTALNRPLGSLALDKGLLSERQLLRIHTEQKTTDRRFGELAVDLGYLTPPQLDELLAEQRSGHAMLGEVLVGLGALTRAALDEAVAAWEREQEAADADGRASLADASELVQTAAALTTRILLRMGRLHAKVGRVVADGPVPAVPPDDRTRVFVQRVAGEPRFGYLLAVDDGVTLGLARSMLEAVSGKEDLPTTVDALVLDAGKELVNIVVGQLCARLGQQGARRLTPSPPEVMDRAPAPAPGERRSTVELALAVGPATFAIDVAR